MKWAECLAVGSVPPSKIYNPRNYQGSSKDVVITIVVVPVVDVQTVGRVEVTNIGDVSLNFFPKFFSDLTH